MDTYIDPDRPLKYEYRCINNSIYDRYVLRHWWPIAIKAIPARMPSNLVSMVGNLGSYFAFLILCGALFGPVDLVGRTSPWIFGLVALGLFFYQTLDALDGLQARRIGTAGPLGEFVDHWFDSFNVFLFPLGLALAFPVIPPVMVAVMCLFFAAADWLMIRSISATSTLVFETISTEEGQALAQFFYLSVWILGYDFWIQKVFGIPLVCLAYGLMALGMIIASLHCAKTAGGFRDLAAEMLSLAPLVAWTILAIPRYGTIALLVGGLLVGFSGSRFSGELMRERLLGAAYRPLIPDQLVIGFALLASSLLPGLPDLAPLVLALAALAWTLIALGFQFAGAIARVRQVIGMGLFGPVKRR